MLPEITEAVDLCLPSGALDPRAVGWSRVPLHRANLRTGNPLGRAATWSRTKRWEYWCVITPDHVVALSATSLNYAGIYQVWVLDRHTGEEIDCSVTDPLSREVRMPSVCGGGPVRARSGPVAIAVDPVPETVRPADPRAWSVPVHGPTHPERPPRPGARLRAVTPRVRVDLLVDVPAGHECLAVVVPWSDRLFQYTVKDVTLPVHGRLWLDGEEIAVGGDGRTDTWAVMDFGRGRWPYSVVWNWGAGSGVVDGVATGLQLGGKWTDGTGSTENALVLDGRLHYLGEDLSWAYDATDRTAPWFVTGPRVEVRLTPFHERAARTNLGVVSTETHQCFGTWSGWVVDDDGVSRSVDGLVGWAEEAANRW
ncbi:DUF2804 domain-containing protein [Georgenia yuyongxinii]|uniref:DUF2804 domain-containing protein n=1 Tax=Georgenia yuyongxinii TaxID=2589797 RepID=A0A552WW36_9MICO|nr:DUF2804 domain-containing protein [Georgenia yuyongxinii]TRW46513.1 DUF2804 domain-containing protein [Georgenia yuyongxinii]